MKKLVIDLNLDAGESEKALQDGSEEALYQLVTSVNIACGGHAGDESTMLRSIELAIKYNLKIGAHPGFPDRDNFGRKQMHLPQPNLLESLCEQINRLQNLCTQLGSQLTHLKPHGALYNIAAVDEQTALTVIAAAKSTNSNLALVGLAGSPFTKWAKQRGFRTLSEAFVDRRYEPDGLLRKRQFEDALIEDPEAAAAQALQIVNQGSVTAVDGTQISVQADTLCIHGDTRNALAIARAVRMSLLHHSAKI